MKTAIGIFVAGLVLLILSLAVGLLVAFIVDDERRASERDYISRKRKRSGKKNQFKDIEKRG